MINKKISELNPYSVNLSDSSNMLFPIAIGDNNYYITADQLKLFFGTPGSYDDLISKLTENLEDFKNQITGDDTSGWEVIYKYTTAFEAPDVPDSTNRQAGYVPTDAGWNNNANDGGGVSSDRPYLWACMRFATALSGYFGEWIGPILWSLYGKEGKDGNGVEYIFYLSKTATKPTLDDIRKNIGSDLIKNEDASWDTILSTPTYQQNDFKPSNWNDDSTSLETNTDGYRYQYMSKRLYRYDETTKKSSWGKFSEPKLWNYIPKDGEEGTSLYDGDLNPDYGWIHYYKDGDVYKPKSYPSTILTFQYLGKNWIIKLVDKDGNDILDSDKKITKDGITITADSLCNKEITFTVSSVNDIKPDSVNEEDRTSPQSHQFEIYYKVDLENDGEFNTDDDCVFCKSIFTLGDILPGADGTSVEYKILSETPGFTADSFGYNTKPEYLEYNVYKIINGDVTNAVPISYDELKDYNLELREVWDQGDGSSSTDDETYYSNGNTNNLKTYKDSLLAETDYSGKIYTIPGNSVFNYVTLLLYEKRDNTTFLWCSEMFKKSKAGEGYLNIKFDYDGLASLVVNSSGEIVTALDTQYTFTFGLYNGSILIDGNQLIDGKFEELSANEYIKVTLNGIILANKLTLSSEVGTGILLKQNSDGKKLNLIIPSTVITNCCSNKDSNILTISCHFQNDSNLYLDITGSTTIYKSMLSDATEVEVPVSAFKAFSNKKDAEDEGEIIALINNYPPNGQVTYNGETKTITDWTTYPESPEDGKSIYMTTGVKFSGDMKSVDNKYWSTPVCLGDGTSSGTGADGDGYNYIYCRTNSDSKPTVTTKSVSNAETIFAKSTSSAIYGIKDDSEYNSTEEEINVWYDHPVGVSDTYKYEWISIAKYDGSNKKWGSYGTPILWSKYGEKGIDGDGLEYIYILLESELEEVDRKKLLPHNAAYNFDINLCLDYTESDKTYTYQSDDYIPINPNCQTIKDGIKTAIDNTDQYVWSDNPQSISEDTPYQYISRRKKSSSGVYGSFSTPALWSHYGQDALGTGYTILSDNDSIFLDDNTTTEIETVGKTTYTLTGPNGIVSDVKYSIGNVEGYTFTGLTSSSLTNDGKNYIAGTIGPWDVKINSGIFNFTYDSDTTKTISKGDVITIEIEAFVKTDPGVSATSIQIDDVSWYKVATRILKIVVGDFGSGETYKLIVSPNSIRVAPNDDNTVYYPKSSGSLEVSVVKTSRKNTSTITDGIKYYSNVPESGIGENGDLIYVIESEGKSSSGTATILSSFSWNTLSTLSEYYVVNLYVKYNGEWIKVDSETVDVVNDGKNGLGSNPYVITLDNDNVIIDDQSTDVKGITLCTCSFYNGNDLTPTYWHADIASLDGNTNIPFTVIDEDGNEIENITTTQSETFTFKLKIKETLTTNTSYGVTIYATDRSNNLATKCFKISVKDITADGSNYALKIIPDTYVFNSAEIEKSNLSSSIEVIKYTGATPSEITDFNVITPNSSEKIELSSLSKGDVFVYYSDSDLTTNNKTITNIKYSSDPIVLNLYYCGKDSPSSLSDCTLIDTESIDCLKNGSAGATITGSGNLIIDPTECTWTFNYTPQTSNCSINSAVYKCIGMNNGSDYSFLAEIGENPVSITLDKSYMSSTSDLSLTTTNSTNIETNNTTGKYTWGKCLQVNVVITDNDGNSYGDTVIAQGMDGYYFNTDEDGTTSIQSYQGNISAINQTAASITSTISSISPNLCIGGACDNISKFIINYSDSDSDSPSTLSGTYSDMSKYFSNNYYTFMGYYSNSELISEDENYSNKENCNVRFKQGKLLAGYSDSINTPNKNFIYCYSPIKYSTCYTYMLTSKLKANTTYTITFYAWHDNNSQLFKNEYYDLRLKISCDKNFDKTENYKEITIDTNPDQKYKILLKTSSSFDDNIYTNIGFYITGYKKKTETTFTEYSNQQCVYCLSSIQVEEGTEATNWKDYGNSISEIAQNANKIDLYVSDSNGGKGGLSVDDSGVKFSGTVSATTFEVQSANTDDDLDLDNGIMWFTTIGVIRNKNIGTNTSLNGLDSYTPVILVRKGSDFFVLNPLSLVKGDGLETLGVYTNLNNADISNLYINYYKDKNGKLYTDEEGSTELSDGSKFYIISDTKNVLGKLNTPYTKVLGYSFTLTTSKIFKEYKYSTSTGSYAFTGNYAQYIRTWDPSGGALTDNYNFYDLSYINSTNVINQGDPFTYNGETHKAAYTIYYADINHINLYNPVGPNLLTDAKWRFI